MNPQFTWDRWSEWAGIDRTTLVEMAEDPAESVAICRLMERTNQRPRVLNKYLRHFPTLDHPAFAHDPLLASQLESLIQKRSGVTLITSPSTLIRVFTAYVFAHEYERASSLRTRAFGISAFDDEVFVPFSGLLTLQSLNEKWRKSLLANFESSATRAVTAPLIFIDVWNSNRRLVNRFLDKAETRHIIVADDSEKLAKFLRARSENTHVVVVSSVSPHRLWAGVKTADEAFM
jgi:hypothetical protein